MSKTINVPRELLERLAEWDQLPHKVKDALTDLRALLSAPSPAGVDGLEVVAYTWSHEKGITVPTMRNKPPFWPGKGGYTSEPLCRLSDAQATIDGLRADISGDCAYRNGLIAGFGFGISDDEAGYQRSLDRYQSEIHEARAERDQLANRIGELEQILRDLVPGCKWRIMRPRIDAALSEVDK